MEDFEPVPQQMDAESKARIERCVPVVREVIGILNEHLAEMPLGENAEVKKAIIPVTERVLALFLERNINWMDRHVIMQLAMQPLSFLGEAIVNATEISWDRALTELWKKESLDLKFQDVHDVLTKITPKA